jgi:hypothetical protein
MIKNKKGIELSINFIVILILSIAIFGFGIVFLRNMMEEVEDITKITEKDFENHMENLLCDSSEKMCIGTNRKEINRNRVGFFTLGIRNTYDEIKDFYIDVEEDEDFQSDSEIKVKLNNELRLEPNEHEQVGIAVGVPGGIEKGTYVLNVYACIDEYSSCEEDSDKRYGTTQKIYVVVN